MRFKSCTFFWTFCIHVQNGAYRCISMHVDAYRCISMHIDAYDGRSGKEKSLIFPSTCDKSIVMTGSVYFWSFSFLLFFPRPVGTVHFTSLDSCTDAYRWMLIDAQARKNQRFFLPHAAKSFILSMVLVTYYISIFGYPCSEKSFKWFSTLQARYREGLSGSGRCVFRLVASNL